jgi:hypothetical protein
MPPHPVLILTSLGLIGSSLLLAFPKKPYMHTTCHANLILLDLIILIVFREQYKLSSIFSNLIPVHPSLAETFSSAHCLQMSSLRVLPSVSQTKLHLLSKYQTECGWSLSQSNVARNIFPHLVSRLKLYLQQFQQFTSIVRSAHAYTAITFIFSNCIDPCTVLLCGSSLLLHTCM